MFTIIFFLALIWVTWKLFVLGMKATWGIAKLVCTVLLLPLFLVGLVFAGLMYVAVPVLLIMGIIALIRGLIKS